MKDGYIPIREHKQALNMYGAICFIGGGLFTAGVNLWLAYCGVSL